MTKTLPESETDKYLQLLIERRISDAEREIEDLRPKIDNTEWNRGCIKALDGLLITRKANNDKYLFFAKKEFDKKSLKALAKDFAQNASNPLYGDYDRGYFSALARLMKIMEAAGVYSLSNNNRSQTAEAKAVAQ